MIFKKEWKLNFYNYIARESVQEIIKKNMK